MARSVSTDKQEIKVEKGRVVLAIGSGEYHVTSFPCHAWKAALARRAPKPVGYSIASLEREASWSAERQFRFRPADMNLNRRKIGERKLSGKRRWRAALQNLAAIRWRCLRAKRRGVRNASSAFAPLT
jgi:hypothetical protein